MKLVNKINIKNLKLNKKRTIVTIIGIILATFLLTSVLTIVCSFQKSLIENSKIINGDYHYEFLNVPITEKNVIVNNSNIEESFYTQEIGEYLLSSTIGQNCSIEILGVAKNAIDKLGFTIQEGRMPENNNEIVISDKLKKYQNEDFKIGSTITLTNNNNIEGEQTYTIVGTINITNTYIERYSSNMTKYIAITDLNDNNFNELGNINIYVKLNNLDKRIETVAEIVGIDNGTLKSLTVPNKIITEVNLQENESNKYFYLRNNNLISMETGQFEDETATMIHVVAGIVILVIILTSTYCIRNSFDIAITERIKQYGTLASVGATKKQIRKIVFREAAMLGIIAIPIGIISGILVIYGFLKIMEINFDKNLFGMNFVFSTNLTTIALIVLFSSLVLYFSARKSARKASKISPIDAIRDTKENVIDSKKIKAPKFIKKLFGIGGVISYKNIKRNKKRYRTTTVSIIISVALTIIAISFMKCALSVAEIYVEKDNYDIALNDGEYEKIIKIAKDPMVSKTNYELLRMGITDIINVEEHYTEDTKYIKGSILTPTISLGQEEYENYLNTLNLTYEEAKDKIILISPVMQEVEENDKTTHKLINVFDYKSGDKISFSYNNKIEELEIIKVTSEKPMTLPNGPHAYLIISDELMDKIRVNYYTSLYIQCNNDIELEKYIQNNYSDAYSLFANIAESRREQEAIFIIINVFLYGFVIVTALIGTTNIFNTITTSMELRQREFAHLKAIGMTKKEFNRMIRLESLFYGIKSLAIGIPIGILFSYFIYLAFSINIELVYSFPIEGVLISIIVVGILISCIMRYSLNKINKKNIIETLKNDNI